MFRFVDNSIVFNGWERGIADAPYVGLADMRNIDITTTPGEASVCFTAEAVTLPPAFNAVAYTAQNSGDTITLASVTGLYEGCAVVLDSNTATGLADDTVYYVRNIVGLTFQVSLYPNSPIVEITANGTGTLTTYQYGNQRNLTNNGSPVSYFEAPEIGGVLLVDLSNYVWLWQQGSAGASPENSILFLGNIGGIAAQTNNQTGVAYWNGYVCLIQQPATIDMLNWQNFSSAEGEDWHYDAVDQYLTLQITATQPAAAVMRVGLFRIEPEDPTGVCTISDSGTVFEASSSSTIVSASLTLQEDDYLFVWGATYTAVAVTGVTFNAQALTAATAGTSTGFWMSQWWYKATSVETSSITATYGSATTNRLLMYAVVRGATGTPYSNSTGENSTASLSLAVLQQKPNVMIVAAAGGGDADEVLTFNDYMTLLDNPTGNSAGCYGIAYVTSQGSSDTLKKSVPVTVGENNILYWGSGEQYVGSLLASANFSLNSTVVVTNQVVTSGLTYNLNGQALDLPENERVENLSMDGGQLYVGATSNKLYPWDTISPSFDFPIEFPEYGLVNTVSANNTVYVLGGNLGRIYQTNGASAALYKEIPEDVTGSSRPHYFFWDVNKGNGELYFAFEAYPNGSTTPVDTVGGVWAVNANTGALRLVQKPLQGYDVLTRMVCPVGHGQSQTFLRPPGQGLLVGYSDGNAHYLDYSVATPYTDYSAYIDTDIVPVGTYFSQQTFEHIEYKLAAPMVTGESIRISQRSNLSDSFTQIAEFTTTGLISDQASINWENVQWVQFRIELKSTDTNPSFTRLRELRLR